MLEFGIDLDVWPWIWLAVAVVFALIELTVIGGYFLLLPWAASAFAAALLGLMHLDQTPGNSPSVTGVDVARVLGRLTPGSPQNHQRLLMHLGAAVPAVRPLRSAVG